MKPLQLTLSLLTSAMLLVRCGETVTPPEEKAIDTSTTFDLEAAKARIKEQTWIFTESHISRDTAYLNNIFTDDARVYPPGAAAVVGRKAISQLNADWVSYGIHVFREESTAMYGNEEYIIDEGTYYLTYGEENTKDQGKYINIWQNVGGEWRICSNIWNAGE